MSIFKVTITEDHLKLLKNLKITRSDLSELNQYDGIPNININEVFGSEDILSDAYLIIYGKPKEYNPFDETDEPLWSKEEEEYMLGLLKDLYLVLDVVLYTGEFKLGTFKTKTYLRDWKEI